LISARILVSGKVQNVGFRYFTLDQAHLYAIKGWVKNTADGKVEMEIEGSKNQVPYFIEAIRKGPSGSRVINLQVVDIPIQNFINFKIV
jgi:acylphosphatase